MRPVTFIVIASVCTACQRPVDVGGLYVNDHGPGNFLPCDRPKAIVLVNDSTLRARYHLTATQPYQPVFVRLRGIPVDSGSIYYSQHYFLVQRVLEVRPRKEGECANAAPVLPLSLQRAKLTAPAF
jgi:hypothetical protein